MWGNHRSHNVHLQSWASCLVHDTVSKASTRCPFALWLHHIVCGRQPNAGAAWGVLRPWAGAAFLLLASKQFAKYLPSSLHVSSLRRSLIKDMSKTSNWFWLNPRSRFCSVINVMFQLAFFMPAGCLWPKEICQRLAHRWSRFTAVRKTERRLLTIISTDKRGLSWSSLREDARWNTGALQILQW